MEICDITISDITTCYNNKNIYDRFVRDYFSFLISLMNWLICHVLFTRRIARLTFLTTRIGSKRRFTFCSETKLERTRNSRVCWVFADTLLPLPLVTYSWSQSLKISTVKLSFSKNWLPFIFSLRDVIIGVMSFARDPAYVCTMRIWHSEMRIPVLFLDLK